MTIRAAGHDQTILEGDLIKLLLTTGRMIRVPNLNAQCAIHDQSVHRLLIAESARMSNYRNTTAISDLLYYGTGVNVQFRFIVWRIIPKVSVKSLIDRPDTSVFHQNRGDVRSPQRTAMGADFYLFKLEFYAGLFKVFYYFLHAYYSVFPELLEILQ